jgi:tetratricopeptide (TPR) repeat protein
LLVSEPGTHERQVRLAGVEARQMARAFARFKMRSAERGLAAVTGGLYLVKPGELTPTLLGPSGPDALRGAAREASVLGDEGRAKALYEILVRIAGDADRADAKTHLDAIDSWTKDALMSGGQVAAASGLERVLVRRRMLLPSEAAVDEASSATIDWFRKAVNLQVMAKATRVPPGRDDQLGAWRALQTGPAVMAAIYLRDADANGALGALDKADARPFLAKQLPDLVSAIEGAADGADAQRWLEVLHAMRPLTRSEGPRDEDDFMEDRELFRAAELGVAMAAYRMDPTLAEPAVIVAANLQELGMAEATASIMFEAARAHPDSRTLGAALGLTLNAMRVAVASGDVDAARRAFRAAQPLLGIADAHPKLTMRPSAPVVRAVMGEIELGEGRLDDARALLQASAKAEKSGQVLLTLAKIDWRDNHAPAALENLREALTAPDTLRDHALRGEILVMTSDILREQGDVNAARTPLVDALRDLTQARAAGDDRARAAIERVLSKVLDRFGAAAPAQRALDRAFEAAPRDKSQASQTVFQIVARAFVRGDLKAAREGLQRAGAADLDTEDMVYFALWVRLLEKQLKAPTDGAPDRIFASVPDDGRWIGKLAQVGLGKMKADDLASFAKTPSQKTEAIFYAAMDRRASGDAKIDDQLKQVIATSVALEEVKIAREILGGAKRDVGALPTDVSIP